jgi:hypothetical protein
MMKAARRTPVLPAFSLFREYAAQLVEHGKKFGWARTGFVGFAGQ